MDRYKQILKKLNSYNENIIIHMFKNIHQLEKQYVNIADNSKLDGIKSISLPTETIRLHFLSMVEENKILLENKKIAILYNYLLKNHSCINYSNCIKECYNTRLAYQYPYYAISTLRNLYILLEKKDTFIKDSVKAFNNLRIIRLNSSGECNKIILDIYLEIIKKCKYTKFYIYTKNYKLFNELKNIPKNLIVNISIWDNMKRYILNNYKNLNRFNFYHTVNEEEINNINIKDYNIEGKKSVLGRCSKKQNNGLDPSCLECGLCYKKNKYIVTLIR